MSQRRRQAPCNARKAVPRKTRAHRRVGEEWQGREAGGAFQSTTVGRGWQLAVASPVEPSEGSDTGSSAPTE